jgi:hypothetical protein
LINKYSPDGHPIFYKVVNVYQSGSYYKLDGSIALIGDRRTHEFEKDGEKYAYRVIPAPPPTSELSQTWWYKWYFNIPPCARGRLTQSTGTCWMNATLNCLLLVNDVSKLLIEEWIKSKSPHKQIQFKDYLSEQYTLKDLLLSTVNNLLISRIKAKPEDGNFVAALAARVK